MLQLPKLARRVRLPSPAPFVSRMFPFRLQQAYLLSSFPEWDWDARGNTEAAIQAPKRRSPLLLQGFEARAGELRIDAGGSPLGRV